MGHELILSLYDLLTVIIVLGVTDQGMLEGLTANGREGYFSPDHLGEVHLHKGQYYLCVEFVLGHLAFYYISLAVVVSMFILESNLMYIYIRLFQLKHQESNLIYTCIRVF